MIAIFAFQRHCSQGIKRFSAEEFPNIWLRLLSARWSARTQLVRKSYLRQRQARSKSRFRKPSDPSFQRAVGPPFYRRRLPFGYGVVDRLFSARGQTLQKGNGRINQSW